MGFSLELEYLAPTKDSKQVTQDEPKAASSPDAKPVEPVKNISPDLRQRRATPRLSPDACAFLPAVDQIAWREPDQSGTAIEAVLENMEAILRKIGQDQEFARQWNLYDDSNRANYEKRWVDTCTKIDEFCTHFKLAEETCLTAPGGVPCSMSAEVTKEVEYHASKLEAINTYFGSLWENPTWTIPQFAWREITTILNKISRLGAVSGYILTPGSQIFRNEQEKEQNSRHPLRMFEIYRKKFAKGYVWELWNILSNRCLVVGAELREGNLA
ncbi:hypothetical protein TWF481_000538 [Arthrobotrys musiformis]|uniref:Uncharacterized protein n=1 Tax=Arthrobotrys musiformis TaxID=47236 RepID=A0AAV9WP02_9PEZI